MSIHGVCTRWCVYVGVCVSPGILEVMDDGRAEVIGDARVCVSVHCPPGGSLCYCTCAQEAISTKSAGRKWLVSGLEDHRYLSVTKSATRREPVGGTPTSKQEPCSGMHLMLSLSTGPWICHISSRVQVCTDSNGNAESPSPRARGPTGMGCEGSPRGVCADSIGKS